MVNRIQTFLNAFEFSKMKMHKNVQKSAQIYPASIFAMHLDNQLDQKDR